MPRYFPLPVGPTIAASRSNMVDFEWSLDGIRATFAIPEDDARKLEVRFEKTCIVRLLDDMPLSTEEEDTPNQGLVPDHLAYWVEDARFLRDQSEAFKLVHQPKHYRFVTGWTCMDVVSAGEPVFSVIRR